MSEERERERERRRYGWNGGRVGEIEAVRVFELRERRGLFKEIFLKKVLVCLGKTKKRVIYTLSIVYLTMGLFPF